MKTYKDLPKLGAGAIAGLVATLPMTIAMLLMHRFSPSNQKPLPPVKITDNAAQKTHLDDVIDVDKRKFSLPSLFAHYSYGFSTGSFLIPSTQNMPFPPVIKGILFGLFVWIGSYMGLAPSLKLYPHAKDEPASMNTLMIIAHIIWGAVAGSIAYRLIPKSPRMASS